MNKSVGTILGISGVLKRPDLVNECQRCLYEIKTVDDFGKGVFQLLGYNSLMNWLDMGAMKMRWRYGDEYRPPNVVELDGGAVAFVADPVLGVITYAVVDPKLITLVIATAGASELAAAAASAASLASLGAAF